MVKPFNYLFVVALGCAMTFVAMGMTGWLVDPHAYFGRNQGGVIYVDNDRYVKRLLNQRADFNALLLGSSRVAAIDPDDVNTDNHTFLNAAQTGSLPEDIMFLLEDVSDGKSLAVIGFDFFMFNLTERPYRIAKAGGRKSLGPWYRYLFNLTTFRTAVTTIVKDATGVAPLTLTDGQRNPEQVEAIDSAYTEPAYEKVLRHVRDTTWGEFEYAGERVHTLRDIRDYLAREKINAVVFINPLNTALRQLITDMGLGPQFERFKRDVRSVFPEAHDFSDSPWSTPEHFYWTDPFHYRPETGAGLINHMLDSRDLD